MEKSTINKSRLLFASFFTIVAGGVGFAVRGSILVDWGNQFGFTMTELGSITGGGFAGFGIIIILFSLIVDRVGYKPLLILAFFVHFLSLVVTVGTVYIFNSMGREAAYWCLFSGTFLFAVGNGICESVVNPLVATLYPKAKTHYLNILHAGWPGGMILGGLLSIAFHNILSWEALMSFFLIPVIIYGGIIFKEKLPLSEAKEAGISYKEMFRQFGRPLLLVLMLLMVLIGYVELGTDSWIQNITGNILHNPTKGVLLFIYTSALMFILRFFAGPIVHKISPLGLLFVCSILGAIGLYILGNATSGLIMVFAVTIYGIAKTFFWPTMLGVVGERFPRGGAVTMGFVGGVGMLSAGLLGGPGIGYKQDYFASTKMKLEAPEAYDRYKADDKNSFLFLTPIKGLNGSKVAIIKDNGEQLQGDIERWESTGKAIEENNNLSELQTWWVNAKPYALKDKEPVEQAGFYGAGKALELTAFIPIIMAIGYFLLILYFKKQGGYKQIEIK